MISKITYFTLVTWFCCLEGFSQVTLPSKAYMQTCYNKHDCYSISNSAYIFFNSNNNELSVIVDFNKFRLGNDTLDEWLKDLSGTQLVFKGQLCTNDLLLLSHHNSKPIIVNGQINFNGVSKSYSAEVNMFDISKEGLLFMSNGQDYFDRVNVNMQLSFNPKDFIIDRKRHHYKKSVIIGVYRGCINEMKPDMEALLAENQLK